jgi:cyanophycin synthetase
VALELQNMIGHDVGYGRARGGEAPGEYTLVFEHRHEAVGLRAAALALGVVQQAFAGDGADAVRETVARAVDEMAALARTPDTPAPDQRVLCAVTGSRGRREAAALIRRRVGAPARAGGRRGPVRTGDLVVEVAPSYLLEQGLPYARSTLAVVLDVAPDDVSPRFREPDRARQLVTVLVDGVVPGGLAVLPADDAELHEYARRRECRVATFAADGPVRDAGIAQATAWAADGRVVLQRFAECVDGGPLDPEMPPAAQVAAALAGFALAALALEAPNGSRAARADGASATERTRPAGEPRAPEQGAQPPGPGTRP